MKGPLYKVGETVTWVDPDEDNVMKPHAGVIVSRDRHENLWVYLVQESEDFFGLVLEEELTLVKARD